MEFPGYQRQRNSMCNLQGSPFLVLEFPRDLTQFCRISGWSFVFLIFQGLNTKMKNPKGGRVQKSISSTRIGIAQFPSRGRFVHIIFSGISRGACFGISNLSKLIKVTNIKLSQDGGRGSEKYNHSSPFRFFLEYLQPISYNVIVIASQLAIYDMT